MVEGFKESDISRELIGRSDPNKKVITILKICRAIITKYLPKIPSADKHLNRLDDS